MVYLAECVSSPDVLVVFIDSGVDFVLEWPLLVEGDVLKKYVVEDWVDLVHHLDLLVLHCELEVFLRVSDVAAGLVAFCCEYFFLVF